MTKKWINETRVEMPENFRGQPTSDRYLWWYLSLGLLINRHIPDCIPDDVASEHLDRVWREQRHMLPFPLED